MGLGTEKMKLTIEEYVDFFNDLHRLDLTVDQLNQIILMHGFIRMHRRHKMDIMHALESMDLMDPKRSTLQESISSAAFLTVDEVKADLEAIGWQEYSVSSLESISFGSAAPKWGENACRKLMLTDICSPTTTAAVAAAPGQKRKRAPRGKGKRKLLNQIAAVPLLTYTPHNHHH